MERQALQAMSRHVTREIDPENTLPVIKSETEQQLSGRAYTAEQVALVATGQRIKHAATDERESRRRQASLVIKVGRTRGRAVHRCG